MREDSKITSQVLGLQRSWDKRLFVVQCRDIVCKCMQPNSRVPPKLEVQDSQHPTGSAGNQNLLMGYCDGAVKFQDIGSRL